MKRSLFPAVIIAMILGQAVAAGAQDATSPCTIGRFVFCTAIRDLEPVDPAEVFPPGHEMILAFIEAQNIVADTTLKFVWIYGGKEYRTMTVQLPKGRRWRTFDGKMAQAAPGQWRVELRDEQEKVLRSASFTVE